MSEHKSDILSATGKHRVWIGERGLPDHVMAPPSVPVTRPTMPAARGWVRRPMIVPTTANPRHAAITKNLSHFTNYKSWAEKVKSGWKPEDGADKGKGE
jgi:hypothetical protein